MTQQTTYPCTTRTKTRRLVHARPSEANEHTHNERSTVRQLYLQRAQHATHMRLLETICRDTSRTFPCAARALRIDSRRDRVQSRRTSRERSCEARQQHTVKVCEQARRVRAAAAHRVPRRRPTTWGPPSEAFNDRGPVKERWLRRCGSADLRPDTPA